MGGLDSIDVLIYSVFYIGVGVFVFLTAKSDWGQSLTDLNAVQAPLKAHVWTSLRYGASYLIGVGLWLLGLVMLYLDHSLGLSFHALMLIGALVSCLVMPVMATDNVFERTLVYVEPKQVSETPPVRLKKAS